MSALDVLEALERENDEQFDSGDCTDSEESDGEPDAIIEAVQLATRSNEEPCFRDSVLNHDIDFVTSVSKHL